MNSLDLPGKQVILGAVVCIMLGALVEGVVGDNRPDARVAARRRAQRCAEDTITRKLEHGHQISVALQEKHGDECLRRCLENVCGEHDCRTIFPWGFWKHFIEDDMGRVNSNRQRKHSFRCFCLYAERMQLGGATITSWLDGQRPGSKRRRGDQVYNHHKSQGLGVALLQFFVDEMQVLRSRSDSSMLVEKARELRAELIEKGWAEEDLPKMDGQHGKEFLFRWRREYGIVMKSCGMQLKVLWSKVKSRCLTHLTNIWRVRTLWELVHPRSVLKFVSADQKPSWFNNSGHLGTWGRRGEAAPSVKENFAKCHERYTILTVVNSSCDYGSEAEPDPPHVFVLFKGKKNGRILNDIKERMNLPEWVHVQVQEAGSYREEDVIEASQTGSIYPFLGVAER